MIIDFLSKSSSHYFHYLFFFLCNKRIKYLDCYYLINRENNNNRVTVVWRMTRGCLTPSLAHNRLSNPPRVSLANPFPFLKMGIFLFMESFLFIFTFFIFFMVSLVVQKSRWRLRCFQLFSLLRSLPFSGKRKSRCDIHHDKLWLKSSLQWLI